MKITEIEIIPIELTPTKVGYREQDEISTFATVDTIIIKVHTDKDITGLGEAATIQSYFNQTEGSLKDWLEGYRKTLIGNEPRNIIQAHKAMDKVSGEKAPGCHPARAAIDMALYDIKGKANNCPVYEVLGGNYRQRLALLTNLYHESPEEKSKACKDYVDRGYSGLKVKVGDSVMLDELNRENLSWEKTKLISALEAVPSEIYIDADANQTWANQKVVVQIIEDLLSEKYYSNLSLEQPLHYLDYTGHSQLRNQLPIPIILDESVVSPEAMFQIAKQEAADRIVLKINRVGGYWPARKIIDICEATSIGISLDTMPFTKLGDTALCHLGVTIRDPYPVDAEGHNWFESTPFRGGVKLQSGEAILPTKPGLGVEIDQEKLGKLRKD